MDRSAAQRGVRLCCLATSVLLGLPCLMARAQQTTSPSPAPPATPLPDAPSHLMGSIAGTVKDQDGKFVPGAQVTLASDAMSEDRETTSDAEGKFEFDEVPPGRFQITVLSDGVSTGMTAGVLKPSEKFEVPPLALQIAPTKADIDVTMSRYEVAEEEMREEEKQRLGGFLPNFYVVYDWHAAPLTAKQKLRLGFKTVIDPVNFAVVLASAGVEQGLGTHDGYGYGWQGYGKRVGASTADFVSGTMLGGAIIPALLHQDPRYFYMGSGHSPIKRFFYALSTAVITRGDNGKWQPNYSSILGDVSTGAISNAYYPKSDRNGVSLTIENGLLAAASDGVGNVVQEFVFRHFTPHPPTYANTKP